MTHPDPCSARLALALSDAVPTGRVAVFGAGPMTDLAPLGAGVEVITPWRPHADAFAARGIPTRLQPEGRYELALVCLPRARAAARDLVAQALAVTDGPVLVDGQKTDGIDALLREARARTPLPEPVVKAHGKLFRLDGTERDRFADWIAFPQRLEDGFITRPGVFSADGPDPGSQLLAAALPDRLPATVAELGAGWGWLAARILAREGVETLHLIEADHTALACAQANLPDPRVRFHWADATTQALGGPVEAVISNPPFHQDRRGDPGLGAGFIAAAARLLAPQGTFWMVANRHLPYEAALTAAFREVTELPGAPAFKLFCARAPQPAAARRRTRGQPTGRVQRRPARQTFRA